MGSGESAERRDQRESMIGARPSGAARVTTATANTRVADAVDKVCGAPRAVKDEVGPLARAERRHRAVLPVHTNTRSQMSDLPIHSLCKARVRMRTTPESGCRR